MILSIDASSKATGYAVFTEDGRLVKYGVVTASSQNVIARIYKITNDLYEEIKDLKITKVIMEEVQPTGFKSSLSVAKALFMTQGSIRTMIYTKFPRAKEEFVMASHWRSILDIQTGRGIKREELKKADIAKANEIFGLKLVSDDAADAILIGHSYIKEQTDYYAF